ncbi:MAG: hypothetical protein IT434_11315 [Phycisphaerales bacterium]|nr:hypothetical protein [Phycisphaerales bacterium]
MKQTEYDWLYLAAAVNPSTGEALGLIERRMNTPVMNDLQSDFRLAKRRSARKRALKQSTCHEERRGAIHVHSPF